MPNYLELLTSTKGRIGRQTFWILIVGLALVSAILSVIPLIGAVASLALLWPWTCLSIKRLHDMGRAGRLAILPLGVCVLATGLAILVALVAISPVMMLSMLALTGVTAAVSLLAILISVGFVLWIGLGDGQAGDNLYGAPESAPVSLQSLLGSNKGPF